MRSLKTKITVERAQQDAQVPSTWTVFRKGLCDGCWAGCCTLPVEVSVNDLIRLGLTCEEEAAVSVKKLAKRLIKAKILKSFHAKTQIFILDQRNGTDCLYLDANRQCTVYAKRPNVCREFPKIGPRPGFCPATKKL